MLLDRKLEHERPLLNVVPCFFPQLLSAFGLIFKK